MIVKELKDYEKRICESNNVCVECAYCPMHSKKLERCFTDIRREYEKMKSIKVFEDS